MQDKWLRGFATTVVFALLAAALPGSSGPAVGSAAPDGSIVYLVRHAEVDSATDGGQDRPLSDAGRTRASALAKTLADADLTAIYTTPFERTRSTAGAVGERVGVEVEEYDPFDREGLARLLERLRAPGRHLVVGHSNTTPDLVRALGGDPVSPIGESEYDRLYLVAIDPHGATVSTLLRYGEPGASVGMARPHPASIDPGRIQEATLTYRMRFEDRPAGTATYRTVRDDSGWWLTENSLLPEFDVDAVNKARVGPDLLPRSFRATGTMFGSAIDIDVVFADGRATGSSVFPRGNGPSRLDIDAELPPGTLERTSTFFLIHGLPFEDAFRTGRSLGFSWFDTYSGQVQQLVAVVTGQERVSVPAGTFETWRVELRGGTPGQVLWVSREAPRRIVRIEVVGQPWVYELRDAAREAGPERS